MLAGPPRRSHANPAPDRTRCAIETGVPTGNVSFGGTDGSTLYVATNHWITRICTRTRGQGF